MSNSRRDFLSWLGLSSVLSAATSVISPSSAEAQTAKPVDDKWDMSWTDKVAGKYKATFDSPDVSEGAGLFRACIWRNQHKDVYGTVRTDASAVLVLRHEAIELIMNDEYWARFNVGKSLKLKDDKNKWTKTNPIRVAPPGATGPAAEYNLSTFMETGGIVLACNMAFSSVVANYQKADKSTRPDAVKAAKAHIIPGIILQPSGIFAVLRAQEIGCNYVVAS
ncbi:MAG: hypothetical protein ABJB74_16775 [Gemmatimonas sp.]